MAQILFQFYAFPASLLKPEMVRALSAESMILYTLMLDRQRQSGGETITFTRREVMDTLQIASQKARRMFKELEAAGLISRGTHRGASATPIRVFLPDDGVKNTPSIERKSPHDGVKNTPSIERKSPHDGVKNTPLMERKSPDNSQIHLNQKYKRYSRTEKESISPGAKAADDEVFLFESLEPEAQALYQEWKDYTEEEGIRTTVTGRMETMEEMEVYVIDYGVVAVRALTEEAMRNGWRGLYFEKLDEKPHKYDPVRFAPE